MTEFFPKTNPPEPVPQLLTAEEACRYLRLDEGRELPQAVKSLRRLVELGRLRPTRIGRSNRYLREELHRCLTVITEEYAEVSEPVLARSSEPR